MYTILVVDDERDIVSALKIYLTSDGYNVLTAYNGEEALKVLESNEVHLILMDIMMPKLLASSPGKVFSPAEIYRAVWNDEPFGSDSTVAVHIRHLREKIEITPNQPRYIKVVWGQGYKFEDKK